MNQKDLMKKLQKTNILVCVEELRKLLSNKNFDTERCYCYKYITEQLDNIENLIKSYDGDFEKKHLLSRIEHAKHTVRYGDCTTSNQANIILMILGEIETIVNNDNSLPEE